MLNDQLLMLLNSDSIKQFRTLDLSYQFKLLSWIQDIEELQREDMIEALKLKCFAEAKEDPDLAMRLETICYEILEKLDGKPRH